MPFLQGMPILGPALLQLIWTKTRIFVRNQRLSYALLRAGTFADPCGVPEIRLLVAVDSDNKTARSLWRNLLFFDSKEFQRKRGTE